MRRRWTQQEDHVALAWLMTLDEVAESLGRTDREVLERFRELDALPSAAAHAPVPAADAEDALPELPPSLGTLEDLVREAGGRRTAEGMEAPAAEAVVRRVMLHLFRGSIEQARAALEDGWREHLARRQELPQGPAVLDVPLAEVFAREAGDRSELQRLCNYLDQAGVRTVRELLRQDAESLQLIPNVGPTLVAKTLAIAGALRQRAGLADRPAVPVTTIGSAGGGPLGRPRAGRRKSVAADSREMLAWRQEETVRLLPFVERVARRAQLPLPLEDLVQEGAKAVYARRAGRLLAGGQRSGRTESIVSLSRITYDSGDGRAVTIAGLVADPREPARRRRDGDWRRICEGFSDRDRIVLLEYFVAGKSQSEIAAGLGISESRVSQLIGQILARLRELDAQDGRVQETCL